MGTEFWWFYDAAAAAIVLICLFISGKKGVVKAAFSLAGYAIAVILSVSISIGLGKSLYDGIVKGENAKKLNKSMDNFNISVSVSGRLAGETSRHVRAENILKIYKSGKPFDAQIYSYVNNINGRPVCEEQEFYDILHKCYAEITKNIVSEELNSYAAHSAYKKVLEDPDSFNELIVLMLDVETKAPAAEYIAENYVNDAYTEILRLSVLIAFVIGVVLIALLLTKNMVSGHDLQQTLAEHFFGAVLGIIKGLLIVFVIAAAVRLSVVLGDDVMLFFNHEAIDSTYAFKYFYNFAVNHM